MTPEEYIQACRECRSGERAMELLHSAENIVSENEKLLAAGRKMKAIIERNRRYVDERIIDYSEKVKTLTKQVRSLEEQNKVLTEQVSSLEEQNKVLAEQVMELEAELEEKRVELMQLGSLSDCIERLAAVTVRLEKTDKPAEKPKPKKASSKDRKPAEQKEIDVIVNFLNEKAGTSFRASCKDTQKHISARLDENYSIDDFKAVIEKMCAEWKGTEFEQYLRPSTLFSSKFESYLNAKINPQQQCIPKKDKPSYNVNKLLKNAKQSMMEFPKEGEK